MSLKNLKIFAAAGVVGLGLFASASAFADEPVHHEWREHASHQQRTVTEIHWGPGGWYVETHREWVRRGRREHWNQRRWQRERYLREQRIRERQRRERMERERRERLRRQREARERHERMEHQRRDRYEHRKVRKRKMNQKQRSQGRNERRGRR